jgi:tetratricopeptide (TPR) repeat protein
MRTQHMQQASNPSGATTSRRLLTLPLIGWSLVLLSITVFLVTRKSGELSELEATRLLTSSQVDFAIGEMASAERDVRRVLQQRPQYPEAQLLLGKISEHDGRLTEALEHYIAAIPSVDLSGDPEPLLLAAELCFNRLRMLTKAEVYFRRAFDLGQDSGRAGDQLARILAMSGRRDELEHVLLRLVQDGHSTEFHLYILSGARPSLQIDREQLLLFSDCTSHDLSAELTMARLDLLDGKVEFARKRVEAVLQRSPRHQPAQLLLGEILLELANRNDFAIWTRQYRDLLSDTPQFWRLQFQNARISDGTDSIVRVALGLLQRDPNDADACYMIGREFAKRDQHSRTSKPFLQRARLLNEYWSKVEVARTGQQIDELHEVVDLASRLGLIWEAYGWGNLIQKRWRHDSRITTLMPHLRGRCQEAGLIRTDPKFNPALTTEVPIGLLSEPVDTTSLRNTTSNNLPDITYRDDASDCGVDFQYYNGGDPTQHGIRRMFELAGGGVGFADIDMDGWPDLYFTQGCVWERRGQQVEHLDALYRNIDGTRFSNVTASAKIHEDEFSQGVAAGDIDNDGFPDLLVGNIGANRLFQNNGDGTFSMLKPWAGDLHDNWTTSCMVADINGDTIPDLFAVNYLNGNDVFQRVCPDTLGDLTLTCRPQQFSVSPNHLYIGKGNTLFVEATLDFHFGHPKEFGLGVAFGHLGGSPQPSLFVANDGSPNTLFTPSEKFSPSGPVTLFEESGLASGIALNGNGRAEACMGVAVDDVDGNGHLDILVTNFEGESNTLYLQDVTGFFTDATDRYGLHDPSLPMLGFGTQFLDANADGWPDLIVANGHVNDLRDGHIEFAMRPQFFTNVSGQRFVEMKEDNCLGAYFESKRLGRGLAVADWNRDGLPDAAVSHLGSSASLLTNTTRQAGHWLAVRLIGTRSSRDAIGTRVTLITPGQKLRRELTAGCGFQASNEKLLLFGLGACDTPVSILIDWPSCDQQTLSNIPVDQHVTVVEGGKLTWTQP